MPRPLSLFLLALLGAGPPAHSLGAQDPPEPPPALAETPPVPLPSAELAAWFQRFRGEGHRWWSGARIEYRQLLPRVRHELQRSPEDLRRVGTLLLEISAEGIDVLPRRAHFLGGSDLQATRRGALDVLDGLIEQEVGAPLVEWLASDVLALPDRHTKRRRLVALYLLGRHRSEAGKLALLSVARDGGDRVRPEALQVLAGWPDPAVDLFLVGLLARPFDPKDRPHPFTLLLTRAREVDEPLAARASTLLGTRLQPMLLSSRWREAARAIELAAALTTERRVPLLIDALSAWQRRARMGTGSRRIVDDIVRDLREISGRSIGTNPRNWITWWIAYREGKTPLHVDDEGGGEARTGAGFFGLRPVSDKVTFVIDISGSMQTSWQTEEHSRYVEAVEQMMRYLQGLGEEASFNVILFSDGPLRSSPHLVKATTRTLASARNSLLSRVPGGATRLRPAVELALRLDDDGNVDPERLEADTVIVLCDGETEEGNGWVRPLLDRVQFSAQVRIHCVLVGTKGDGTLERLAAETGGDFVRID